MTSCCFISSRLGHISFLPTSLSSSGSVKISMDGLRLLRRDEDLVREAAAGLSSADVDAPAPVSGVAGSTQALGCFWIDVSASSSSINCSMSESAALRWGELISRPDSHSRREKTKPQLFVCFFGVKSVFSSVLAEQRFNFC